MLRLLIYYILIHFFLSISITAQKNLLSQIEGTVQDKSSKKPLGNVNVYLANSMIGSATNNKGHYEIRGLSAGRYKLIVSSIGYYHRVREFEIKSGESSTINIRLVKRTYELPTVNVIDEEDYEWLDNYDIFVREFIGETDNSDDTEIINPFLLNFSKNINGNLTASIPEPLEIMNRALGYRILYFLEQFEYDDIGSVRYAGYPVFEELNLPDEEMKVEWDEQRYETYLGSFRHFIKAMCDKYIYENTENVDSLDINQDELDRYSTVIYHKVPWEKESYEHRFAVEADKLLAPGSKPNELKFSFPNYLQINYSTGFLSSRTSTLKLHADTVNIDINGRYHDEYKIQRFGYWAEQRIADMLPLDYKP